ncbi:hypothetical protein CI109_105910 [Kwoniella shandongensis]|uniref:Uncharacterized protein n=1 Tax=Kwoniella shandongensis TaxID=1734106 RepID=A0A5M6BSP8_9TREE|nr:uncharacterized protein CI109_006660 [Kwoniella shandongensis]KAA5525020.1 hypothetical protein CI109_006660 [Kwoniella shandongensis]
MLTTAFLLTKSVLSKHLGGGSVETTDDSDSDSNSNTSSPSTRTVADPPSQPQPSADIRLYNQRASYSLRAAIDIFQSSPIVHLAFVHPGDGKRAETLMNMPLVAVVVCDGEDENDKDHYAVYLHTHKHSGIAEAIAKGNHTMTATTTKVDGLVFSPTPHDHSLNYRSATLHLHQATLLDDDLDHEEKRSSLAEVTNVVTGYDRIALVGKPDDHNTRRTTIVRARIAAVSCKQRYGAFNHAQEPITEPQTPEEEEYAFKGIVPCWTTWGTPQGFGRDRDEVEQVFEERSVAERDFAEKAAWAHEDAAIEGLGKKRKPVRRF